MIITTVNVMGVTSDTETEVTVHSDFTTATIGRTVTLFGDRDRLDVSARTGQLVSLTNLEVFAERLLEKIRREREKVENQRESEG